MQLLWSGSTQDHEFEGCSIVERVANCRKLDGHLVVKCGRGWV